MQVLYVICVLQIFSVSLWLVFSTGQKFLMLIKFNLSIFTFMDHTCGGVYKDSSLNWNSHRFLSYFYGFAFSIWVIIQFDFIFVKNVRSMSGFFFFCIWTSSCSSTMCWRDCPVSIRKSCSFIKDKLSMFFWVCFWTLCSVAGVFVAVLLLCSCYFDSSECFLFLKLYSRICLFILL